MVRSIQTDYIIHKPHNKEKITMGRKKCTPEFKVKVALEAIKEGKTINEIASLYGIHLQMVRT